MLLSNNFKNYAANLNLSLNHIVEVKQNATSFSPSKALDAESILRLGKDGILETKGFKNYNAVLPANNRKYRGLLIQPG